MDTLPQEIAEEIALKFPLTRKGSLDLVNFCKTVPYCGEEFWRTLYRDKIDRNAKFPPLSSSWRYSYLFFSENRYSEVPDAESIISELFIFQQPGDFYILSEDLSGFDLQGKAFFFKEGDLIDEYDYSNGIVTLVYHPYLLRNTAWENYYLERGLPVPEDIGSELNETPLKRIEFPVKLLLQIGK